MIKLLTFGAGSILLSLLVSFVLALPFMWCWNFAVVPALRVGELGWLQAWCLLLAVRFLAPIVSYKRKE